MRVEFIFRFLSKYVSAEILSVIVSKVQEAAAKTEWSNGEKTLFVQNAVRAVAAETSTPYDDFIVETLITVYNAMRKGKK